MNDYIIRYADGQSVRVQASTADQARTRGYKINDSGVIVDIDKV